ncbi:pitrilysin family protein [Thermithiobacillus plumbiphilus]|uniref:Pitrilysin family protein n=1 Tax=Thermithiobacillus plumbiphilus TaxID=1729899 RepID=A0ABU9D8C7_9PROT
MRIKLLGFLFLLVPLPALAVDIQTWQLENGAKVLFVESHEIPMATLRVTFDAGSARDPEQLPGLAAFTAGLLEEGAGGLNVDQLGEQLDRTGGQVSTFADRDQAGIQVKTLSDPQLRQQVGELAALMLTRPDFPEDAIAREKQRTLAGIAMEDEDPGTVASKAFFKAAYGEHPYAHPTSGTRDSVPRFQRQHLLDFYKQYFVGANAVVALVGDLSRPQAEAWVRQVVGQLPQGSAPAPLPAAPRLNAPTKLFVHMPVNQTTIYMGEPAMRRLSPDYFPLLVGNYTLGGGGFSSRLMEEVREKRGLSYSVYSYFMPLQQQGPFQAGLQTSTKQAAAALTVMRDSIERYTKTGPTPQELKAAKDNLTGSFPLRIDSNAKILEYLSLIGFYGLPLNYLDTFQQRVEQVRADEIRRAMDQHLNPARMAVVAVGSEPPGPDFTPAR